MSSAPFLIHTSNARATRLAHAPLVSRDGRARRVSPLPPVACGVICTRDLHPELPRADASCLDTNALALSDIDGDGDLDLILGNFEERQPNLLLLNNGSGYFTQTVTLPGTLPGGDAYTTALAVGDVDGDGLLDIVVGNNDDPNQLLINKGNGTFEAPVNLPGDSPGCVEGVFRSLRLPDPWGKKTNPLSSQGGTEVTEVTVGQG